MTLYMPPINRRKKVEERYNPDSFRVISHDAVESHPKYSPQSYRATFEPPTPTESLFPNISRRTRVLPRPTPDFRSNNPHPKSCSFIRTDVGLLNEPICTVHTRETDPEQHSWWPSRPNKGTLEKGDYTRDTIYRNDFLHTKEVGPPPSYRHSANPNITASRGIAPVNFLREKDGSQGFYKEGISYEHIYNSRLDKNYPIRSKRHGSFVYSKMRPEEKQGFIDQQNKILHDEAVAEVANVERRVEEEKRSMEPKVHYPAQMASSPQACPQRTPKATNTDIPSPKSAPQASATDRPSPKMLPTCASPVEFYDPTGRIPQ